MTSTIKPSEQNDHIEEVRMKFHLMDEPEVARLELATEEA